MLAFSFDEFFSPAVAAIIVNIRQEIQLVSVHDWDQGDLLMAKDLVEEDPKLELESK